MNRRRAAARFCCAVADTAELFSTSSPQVRRMTVQLHQRLKLYRHSPNDPRRRRGERVNVLRRPFMNRRPINRQADRCCCDDGRRGRRQTEPLASRTARMYSYEYRIRFSYEYSRMMTRMMLTRRAKMKRRSVRRTSVSLTKRGSGVGIEERRTLLDTRKHRGAVS